MGVSNKYVYVASWMKETNNTFRANLIFPDMFNVSWHVESNIYSRCEGLNTFPSLLIEILYPDIKDFDVDLFLRSFGKGHMTSDIELWLASTLSILRKTFFPS